MLALFGHIVAALYVDREGPYFTMPDVDAWDEARDARRYQGPHAIVAHPPCGPWGALSHLYRGGDAARELAPLAVEQVRAWGGALEHPAHSKLWERCALPKPGDAPDVFGGFSIDVCQVDWGHPARKRTWLYLVGVDSSALVFPPSRTPTHWVSGSRRSYKSTRSRGFVPEGIKVCSAQQRRRTPPAFARWLVDLAHHAQARKAA